MILRKFQWTLVASLHLLAVVTSQRQYDENEWIPIAPSKPKESTQKAEGRVLNLDAPPQNFFPDNNEYLRKRQPQQYLQETSFAKGANLRPPKPQEPYKFEPVVQQPQFLPQPQFLQAVQQIPYVPSSLQQIPHLPPAQRPEQILSQPLVPPQNYQQSIGLNQELLGAIQHQGAKPRDEKENVQLLYVPLENLKQEPITPQPLRLQRPQQVQQHQQIQQHQQLQQRQQAQQHQQIQQQPTHKQAQLTNIEDDFLKQALAAHKLHQQFSLGEQEQSSSSSTTPSAPKKRKPNQPPLAVYMEKQGSADVKDVLQILKHAKTISVQDSVGPNAPKVFVGPSNINPDGYAKFPLPYLSAVQGNRIERKVDQLPFFVAPLSYKTPEGYSKIPLPSPHVGSVVVSTKEHLHDKLSQPTQQQTAQNQIEQDFEVKQSQFLTTPKPYLFRQPAPQTQNPLFTFGNEYLSRLPTGDQTYEVSSSKGFTNEGELNQKENYDDTSSKEFLQNYRPTEKAAIRNNFQSSDYDLGSQAQKELTQNYNIQNVENKARFTPTYETERTPQLNQFSNANYVTGRPADTYELNVVPVRQTTTTTEQNSVAQTRYKVPQNVDQEYIVSDYNTRGSNAQNPFSQVINQYEIEQINSQFSDESTERYEPVRSTTPLVSTQRYQEYEIPSTPRSRSRTRQRGRPSSTTTITPHSSPQETYTVLEEFAVNPKTTTTTTIKYTTEVETIPAKVYKLEPQAPVFQSQLPSRQEIQTQAPRSAEQILQTRPNEEQYLRESTPKSVSDNKAIIDFNQEFLPQIKTSENQQQQEREDPHLTPLVFNRGQSEEEESFINPYTPGLLNNLQDQAIRPLLVPGLLAPTEKTTTTTTEEVHTTTTTEAPKVETTTQRRTRGRQRGNASRYNSPSTTTSSPRRNVSRRRPNYTRPTTERAYTQTTTEAYEPTRRTSNQRQRFRTRGRPVSKEQATEQVVQTTEAFKQPSLVGGFQVSNDPQSYMQFDHVIDNQQVIAVQPNEENTHLKEYHQVYSLPKQVQTEQRFEEVSTTAKPVLDVKITHPVSDRTIDLTTATDRFIRIKSTDEEATKASAGRPRVRARTRSRFSSTTPKVTTEEPKADHEEEFYGFIRQPNFKRPEPVQSTTQEAAPVYSSSYNTPKTVIQVENYDSGVAPDPVQFVGQIRPKYSTTESLEASTEAPRRRTRVRIPTRKTSQAYNEVKSDRLDDQVTRRSSVVRSRSRGKTHFKAPTSAKSETEEEENYPAGYLKSRTTTERNSFQITIDPSNDDQETHSSIYSSQIYKGPETQWVEATKLPNQIEIEAKQMFSATDEESTTDADIEEQTATEMEEEAPTTYLPDEETTTVKSKRRGVWKLVKHKPVDSFQTAESQNYFSVLNAYGSIEKKNEDFGKTSSTFSATTTTQAPPKTTQGSIFDTLYNMLGFASQASQIPQASVVKEEITTTPVAPTFPEEITDEATTEEVNQTDAPAITTTEASVKNYDEPWDIKTSTSTEVSEEISHETEICYKGKCVKSKKEEPNL